MKILVAVDFSLASAAVIGSLVARPWPAGTRMEVVSAADIERLPFAPSVVMEIQERTEDLVNDAAKRLREAGIAADSVVITGDPRVEVTRRAVETGANWIAMGPHSTTGVIGFLLGSVAKEILRNAPCSVEIVRAPMPLPGREGMRVLLATDGSTCSVEAAHSIAKRQWPKGTEVKVLSVVELNPTFMQAAFEPPFADQEGMEEIREAAIGRAQNAIAEARKIIEDSGVTTSESLSVLLEDAKKIILDEAQDWKADLIVLGSHGRHGFQRFLIGSVSEAVAMHAGCSVDVIRVKAT
ncbi:MAG: universal stress protein [Bryobacteraceae bacterium]